MLLCRVRWPLLGRSRGSAELIKAKNVAVRWQRTTTAKRSVTR
jgi:hypothetical protein